MEIHVCVIKAKPWSTQVQSPPRPEGGGQQQNSRCPHNKFGIMMRMTNKQSNSEVGRFPESE